jgi:tetratricopeptide (TPR) repeat protein
VRKSLNDGDQRRLVELLRPCLVSLGQRAPKLKDRVVELVVQKGIESSSKDLLEQLIRATSSLAFDPHWNRAWALFHERNEDSDTGDVDVHWETYVADIAHVACWTEADCRLAEAIVWNHLGRLHAGWGRAFSMADDDDDSFFGDDDFDDDDLDDAENAEDRRRAREYLERAQSTAPDVLKFWKSSVVATMLWKDEKAETEAMLKLLEHFPDDLESLNNVSVSLMNADRAPEALPFLERALRLKPLDESFRDTLFSAHVSTARHKALKKDFAGAREQFDAAEKCSPSKVGGFVLLSRRCVMERKAGNKVVADALEQLTSLADPDPNHAMLLLLIESIRYKLPKTVSGRYEAEWRKALLKKCTSQAAGMMAALLRDHLVSGGYLGIDSHCKLVATYLKRTSRVKFERQHLRSVCDFFLEGKSKLRSLNAMEELRKAAARGQKQFPDDPCFLMFLCDVEYGRGPRMANLRTMTSLLNRALDLAQKNPDLAPPRLVDKIRDRQEEIQNASELSHFDSPFGFSPFGFSPFGHSPPQSGTSNTPAGMRIPPQMQSMIDEICRRTGMSVEEVLDKAMNGTAGFGFDDDEDEFDDDF